MLNRLIGATSSGASSRQLLQEADRLRDQRKWRQAAEAYRRVLVLRPDLDPIWIQLGHALKEAADTEGAEVAYRRATYINPRSVDGYVQLGHVQKNSGRTAAAALSFASALEIDRQCRDALRELISLGKGAIAGTRSNVGFQLLAEARSTLARLKETTRDIERMLPDIQSLCSVPATDFTLFTERFRLPPPPEYPETTTWIAVIIDEGASDIFATIRTIAQQPRWQSVHIYRARPELEVELAQISNAGLSCPVRFFDSAAALPVAQSDWLVLIKAGTEMVPLGLSWLEWAVSQVDALALYADEEFVEREPDGRIISSRGYFKATYDPESGGSCYGHSLIAVRSRSEITGWIANLEGASIIDEVERGAGAAGRIAHLPRVLSRRTTPRNSRMPAPLMVKGGAGGGLRWSCRRVMAARI